MLLYREIASPGLQRSWHLNVWQAAAETSISKFGDYYFFSVFFVLGGLWMLIQRKGMMCFKTYALSRNSNKKSEIVQVYLQKEAFWLSFLKPDLKRKKGIKYIFKIKPWAWNYRATIDVTPAPFWWTQWCLLFCKSTSLTTSAGQVQMPCKSWMKASFTSPFNDEQDCNLCICKKQDGWPLGQLFSVKLAHTSISYYLIAYLLTVCLT